MFKHPFLPRTRMKLLSMKTPLSILLSSIFRYLLSHFNLYYQQASITRMLHLYSQQAKDHENDRVTYSIVAGNELGHFKMEKNNGSLLLAESIDREQISRYVLTVRAEDTGGLSSVAQVMVRVLDANDRSPEFIDLPYIFRVKENDLTGYIGRVHVNISLYPINACVGS